jgi:hypothetical protein
MNIPSTTPGTHARPQTVIAARVATIGALAMTVLALSVPAASAGDSEGIETERGSIAFHHTGDWLWALDLQGGDGYRVRAYLKWTQDGYRHTADVTDNHPRRPRAGRNLSIPEGTEVLLKMCYIDTGGQVQKCSRWQDAKA